MKVGWRRIIFGAAGLAIVCLVGVVEASGLTAPAATGIQMARTDYRFALNRGRPVLLANHQSKNLRVSLPSGNIPLSFVKSLFFGRHADFLLEFQFRVQFPSLHFADPRLRISFGVG